MKQISHFASFLKNIYIKYVMTDLSDTIPFSDDEFLKSSKYFFEKLYDESEFYDDENKFETPYTIYKRLEYKSGTDSDIPELREAISNILFNILIFSKIQEEEDSYYDIFTKIDKEILKYFKKHIPSLPYIQYLEMCIHIDDDN